MDFKLPEKFTETTSPAAAAAAPGGNFGIIFEELKTAK